MPATYAPWGAAGDVEAAAVVTAVKGVAFDAADVISGPSSDSDSNASSCGKSALRPSRRARHGLHMT